MTEQQKHHKFSYLTMKNSSTINFFLSAWAGRIQQILQSDWFRKWAEFPIRAESLSVELWLLRCNFLFIKKCSSLSGNLLNDLCYYVSKNLSVKPLSSTFFSVFITICSLEIVQFVANLAMITTLKCSGLSHTFRCAVEKKWKCYSPA